MTALPGRAVATLAAMVMVAVAWSAWIGLVVLDRASPGAAFEAVRRWQPWGGPAWVPGVRRLVAYAGPAERLQALASLGRVYPLAPGLWIERARASIAGGAERSRVIAMLEVAIALRPRVPRVYWDAAMVALEAGAAEAAVDFLRDYVALQPAGAPRAVGVAGRWLGDEARALQRVAGDNADALESILRYGAGRRNWTLARLAFERLPSSARADPAVAAPYVERLLHAGFGAEALRVWRIVDPAFSAERVLNGDSGRALEDHNPFAWRIAVPAGVRIGLDRAEARSPPASLFLEFDGTENLRLDAPQQLIVVEPGRSYVLCGWWRGRDLTTRSLPHWSVFAHGPERRDRLARAEAPDYGGWPWQRFEVSFTVPAGVTVVRIALQRDPTDDFDRLLAGRVHIDDVTLAPLAGAQRRGMQAPESASDRALTSGSDH